MTDVETITEFGRLWAEAHQDHSTVAKVALLGYDGGWPDVFVSLAIRKVNECGANTAGIES